MQVTKVIRSIAHDSRKILMFILILGAFARFFQLGENSFVADEFLDINASYGYFKTGEWQSWDFNAASPDTIENSNEARDERAFAYKWQVAQLFNVLPPTEGVARSVSAAWGLITLLLVYRMTVYFTKQENMGLIAAFLYALSISALIIDRRLRMYAMFVPVFLFFSWMTYRVLEEKYIGTNRSLQMIYNRLGLNAHYIVPMLLSGALSLHLHLLTLNIVFIVLVYAIVRLAQEYMATQRKLEMKEGKSVQMDEGKKDAGKNKSLQTFFRVPLNKYSVIVVGFFTSLGLMSIVAPSAFALFMSSFSFPDNHYGYFEIVLKDYAHNIFAVLVLGSGVYYATTLSASKKAGLWVTLSFLIPLFMAVFMWRRNVGEQYISFAQPYKIIVMAIGVYAIAKFAHKHFALYKHQSFALVVGLCLVLLPNYGYVFGDDTVYQQTSRSDNPQYRKVFDYFMKNHAPDDILITRDLRSYYVSGAHVHIENIGGEITRDKLTLERLQNIQKQYPKGWVILSDNDDTFVSRDASVYMDKTMERISNPSVRGNVKVYRYQIGS